MKPRPFPSALVLCLVTLVLSPVLRAAAGTISLRELEAVSPFGRDSSAITGVSRDSPLQFRGVMGDGPDTSLGFFDTEKQISFWVRVDGKDADPDLKVIEYNPEDDEAPIKISYSRQPNQPPRTYSLVLQTAQITRGQQNVNRGNQPAQNNPNNAANALLTAITQLTRGGGAGGNAGALGNQGQQGQRGGQQGQQGQRGGAQGAGGGRGGAAGGAARGGAAGAAAGGGGARAVGGAAGGGARGGGGG